MFKVLANSDFKVLQKIWFLIHVKFVLTCLGSSHELPEATCFMSLQI